MRFRFVFVTIAFLVASTLPVRAGDDPANGESLAQRKCFQCHTIEAGRSKVGPSLFGIVDRRAGTVAGFSYSPSYVAAGNDGLIWNPETIFAYLADPKTFIRAFTRDPQAKSRMTFRLRNDQERADIIAYLATLRQSVIRL